MRIQWIKFPVTCPTCSMELLTALRVEQVRHAFLTQRPLELYASCHDRRWYATDHEAQQILEYLESVHDFAQRTTMTADFMSSLA